MPEPSPPPLPKCRDQARRRRIPIGLQAGLAAGVLIVVAMLVFPFMTPDVTVEGVGFNADDALTDIDAFSIKKLDQWEGLSEVVWAERGKLIQVMGPPDSWTFVWPDGSGESPGLATRGHHDLRHMHETTDWRTSQVVLTVSSERYRVAAVSYPRTDAQRDRARAFLDGAIDRKRTVHHGHGMLALMRSVGGPLTPEWETWVRSILDRTDDELITESDELTEDEWIRGMYVHRIRLLRHDAAATLYKLTRDEQPLLDRIKQAGDNGHAMREVSEQVLNSAVGGGYDADALAFARTHIEPLLDKGGSRRGAAFSIRMLRAMGGDAFARHLLMAMRDRSLGGLDGYSWQEMVEWGRRHPEQRAGLRDLIVDASLDAKVDGVWHKPLTRLAESIGPGLGRMVKSNIETTQALAAAKTVGASPLHTLANHAAAGDAQTVRRLVESGPPFDSPEVLNRALSAAAGGGHKDVVQMLIELGASTAPSAKRPSGRPKTDGVILDAVRRNQPETVAQLIEAGADVHEPNPSGYAAIHISMSDGLIDVTRVLVEHGADVNMVAHNPSVRPAHTRPLDHAIKANCGPTIGFLLERGAKTYDNVSDPAALAIRAARQRKAVTTRYLLAVMKVDPNTRDPATGDTLAHIAAALKDGYLLEAILESKPDLSLTNKAGKTPRQVVNRPHPNAHVIRVLNAAGAP